ncbi:hypothetical protein TNCV_2176541 [Trichonephila clavipes]|uniref:Tc1-like transposase DDE domain-containing protein n=1 Tax=Trichonephila clavipes TaxID=2585209 RepID=A0A8X6VTX0_TRICX|nr:hypothetical protein TNCV_2176541 [Trichonephila clavipes]
MSARHHLSDCDCGRVVVRLEAGQSVTTVVAAMEDLYVALMVKRNRDFTPGRIAAKLVTSTSTHILERTISRRLNQVGLYKRKTVASHLSHAIVEVTLDPDFLFMNDNAPSRRTFEIPDTLQRETILCMQWPAYSPEINPIEYAWDALRKQRTTPACTVEEFKTPLREKWDNIRQRLLGS